MPPEPQSHRRIALEVNGEPVSAEVPVRVNLADFLRHSVGLTGTHVGCEHGACGACTVLLDGAAVNACLVMGWAAEGRSVTTIEGIGALPSGAAVLRGLTEANAFQCGYCAPGVAMALAGLLGAEPRADMERVKAALEGNLCRCTGYHSILRGAAAALRHLEGGS
jgi:carbon-monoxide dehydrogenase small subunit